MALGSRAANTQQSFWIPREALNSGPAHVYYDKLNELLDSIGFDAEVERLCLPHYARMGRPGIAPGVYFRMTFVGYLENISSQRGIAWRCQDSLSLRRFLGVEPDQPTPVHASMSNVRKRLPEDVHRAVFEMILSCAALHTAFSGKIAVDSTSIEANAAMRSIERRDTHEEYPEYVERLMREDGVIGEDETPSAEERARFDRQRKGKTLSNKDWQSRTDADARMMKMKNGSFRQGYKVEHAVDLGSDIIVSAKVYHGDQSDAGTLLDTVLDAAVHFAKSAVALAIEAVVADKGYHNIDQLGAMSTLGMRSYIATPAQNGRRRWTDKPEGAENEHRNNAKRNDSGRGKSLHRSRTEQVERSFAQVCTTGGARRSWLRGLEDINKRYLLVATAHNLATVMRSLFGVGKPREWAERCGAVCAVICRIMRHLIANLRRLERWVGKLGVGLRLEAELISISTGRRVPANSGHF